MDTAPSTPAPTPLTAARGRADHFLAAYRRERAITVRVLRAFPAAQAEFRPHERSSSARQLAWTFVVEEELMLRALRGGPVLAGGGFPPAPESWEAILGAFEGREAEIAQAVERASDETLNGTVQFFVAPRQVGDVPAMDFLWFLLHDQIHHRGQLSVYVRMTGGRLPSIYGPTADEPWM